MGDVATLWLAFWVIGTQCPLNPGVQMATYEQLKDLEWRLASRLWE